MKICCLRTRVVLSIWFVMVMSTVVVMSADVEGVDRIPTNIPGLPKLFDAEGRLTHEGISFTTKAYQNEALRLVIEEANKAAIQLRLPEELPICETNITRKFIDTYGMSFLGSIGNIGTRNYSYFVSVGHKLSYVDLTHTDENCIKWREDYLWATNRIDTNAAYQMATQWLAAASMDVDGLNRACTVQIVPNKYWNSGLQKKGQFVPIYDVFWLSSKNRAENYGDTAYVSLFAPTKTLISLNVRDSKYILRRPLVFTNLDSLLRSSNAPVLTNYPAGR